MGSARLSGLRGRMKRVTKANPCAICNRPDWCGVTDDGAIAICMREESIRPTRNGGWLHRLTDATPRHTRTARVAVRGAGPDMSKLAAQYEQRATDAMVADFAASLAVSTETLRRLQAGWTGRAWAFPMRREAGGSVVGIRLRFPDGRKLSVNGGREGLFVPSDLPDYWGLVICEGPTDTAALLTLGFAAIGRPNCSGAVPLLTQFCRGRTVRIMADADRPGRDGAHTLAVALRLVCPNVRVCLPPEGIKDARAWVQACATADDVRAVIARAEPYSIQITRAGGA